MTKLWIALSIPLALAAADSCTECHGMLEGRLQAPAAQMANDVHQRVGLGCTACHGGDPASADPEIAMGRAKGFIAKPARTRIPQLCGRCHSDATLMHRYKPQQRVDQLAQYLTSTHGKKLTGGDEKVATCIDCHGAHGVREVADPLSPVHPLRLPETCARCHADRAHMASYGIPVNQFAAYRSSVHWEALSKRRDLSAPGCAACHGNHGAAPPQAATVGAVCGSCHPLQEQLYRTSSHVELFGCTTCHGNHAIERPTEALLVGAQSACVRCHEPGSAGAAAASEMGAQLGELIAAMKRSSTILDKARLDGMEVSDALLRQQDANEALIKARVALHAFRANAVAKPVREGLAVARETLQAGNRALKERDHRRMGLAFSLLAIAATILGLRLKLRQIEARSKATAT